MSSNSLNRFRVRPAEPRDCTEILRLIKELAAFENMPNAVKVTETDLLRDGFGSRPFFQCLIAEANKDDAMQETDIVGFAMYYYTYDPWIGKLLYLEDFYVMDEYRGWGIGTELLKRLSQQSKPTAAACISLLLFGTSHL
ncbi:spermine N(1)-acetyltransferase 1 [Podarcis lilfordi]|uniref:Spermine N(1)-acetyltransferase 1 n=1 Tax=Podarcis lilfordi TaxID=74358 RepID=A0AA35PMN5_9SAUR|nr:spermine N(1)-acetyltransferase 1 [Podarcis lilfordi]